jgi:DNA-binding IclR family transcriptional regulator
MSSRTASKRATSQRTMSKPTRPLAGEGGGEGGRGSNSTVSALDRGLALLRCFGHDSLVLTPTELSRLTGIPRPSVIRLAATLVAHGLLHAQAQGEGYRLGAGVMTLARRFLDGLDVRAVARGPMQALADATAGSVYLAVRDGCEMVVVEACRAASMMLAARIDVGSRAPLANSALGRACLAAMPADERRTLVAGLRQQQRAAWPALAKGLERALDEHARRAWCLSIGEFHREINSVSVAMIGARGDVMAFNCGGSAFAFGEARLRGEVGPALLAMAAEVAGRIGAEVAGPAQAVQRVAAPHAPASRRAAA